MTDRTGQVWHFAGSVYLIVGPPVEATRVREVMNKDVWYHPCFMIDESAHTVLGETVGSSWEDEPARKWADGEIRVNARRERIA